MEGALSPQQICPLCGKNNHCAMAINPVDNTCGENCWCFTHDINKDSLAQAKALNKNSCICQKCTKAPYVKTTRDELDEK